MKSYDVVIIGGGPAGFAAALSARNAYPHHCIALIRREKTALIPCGIPYTMHRLSTVEEDTLPDTPLKKAGVSVLIGEVSTRTGKVLHLSDGSEIEYEKLIIATGSSPVVPGIPGIEHKGVFVIRKEVDALQELKQAAADASRIAIIGGGYVGVEFADEFLRMGKEITIIDQLPHLFAGSIDPEFSEVVVAEISSRGGELHLGSPVAAIESKGRAEEILLGNSTRIPCDLVLVAVGYKPNLALARRLGVEVNEGTGIVVDEYMRTSEPDIFAVGDCAEEHHFFSGEPWPIKLASTATAQGRLAGSSLWGIKMVKSFRGVLGTFSTMIGDTAIGVSGLTEVQAKSMDVDYIVGTAEAPDHHPGKLPGTSTLFVKLLFARHSHVLLGGQVRGGSTVGEIVNLLAVMIQEEMTDAVIDTMQIGTHPLLTPSPLVYPVISATVDAITQWYQRERDGILWGPISREGGEGDLSLKVD